MNIYNQREINDVSNWFDENNTTWRPQQFDPYICLFDTSNKMTDELGNQMKGYLPGYSQIPAYDLNTR